MAHATDSDQAAVSTLVADYVEELGEGIDYLQKPFTFDVLRKLIGMSVT